MNYEDVALIREDTREVLPIYGATSVVYDRPGIVTQYPVPDRSYVARGTTILPSTIDIEAVESPNFSDTENTGQARLDKVENFLDNARKDGATISFRRPSGAIVPSVTVESYRTKEANEEGFLLTLRLQSVVFAVSRSIQTTTLAGEPRPESTAALEATEETGTGAIEDLTEDENPEGDSFLFAVGRTFGVF